MKLTIIRIVCVLLILAAAGLYAYGILAQGDNPGDNLLRCVVLLLSGIGGLYRTFPGRAHLKDYASAYAQHLGNAFEADVPKRIQLLKAIRLFSEEKYPAALRILKKLDAHARTRDDHHAVAFFTAVCQTALGLNEAAIATYQSAIRKGAVSSRLYSNLGGRYADIGDLEMAIMSYQKAIELDDQNALAYSNLANSLVEVRDFAYAASMAGRAVELNPDQYQAWSALAICHAMSGDEESMKVCFRQAVNAGQDANSLRNAINHYLAAEPEHEEEEYESN